MKKLLLLLVILNVINIQSMVKYPYVVPPLPYAYNALEPYIDEPTMKLHHDAHHKTYVDNLNAALKNDTKLQKKDLDYLLRNLDGIEDDKAKTAITNNGGGHWNHSFFWKIMKPNGGGLPKNNLNKAIKKQFGSFKKFKENFNEEAKKVFGSGWAWLCLNTNGELVIMSTPNQESPISQNLEPIIGLDVWEHAYYLKYNNKRVDYISSWWNVINWDQAEINFKNIMN